MRAVFISYRRDDTEGHAGRLFSDLCERLGSDAVFMDVAGIEPGTDFRRAIDQQVASCGALLAVIGRNWLSAAGADGKRRLDDPLDFVRLETAAALRRGIPVIPVLVHDAQMPRPEQLPEDLRDLAYRNAVELSHTRWDSDLEILVRALKRHIDAPAPGETEGPAAVSAAADLAAAPASSTARRAWPRATALATLVLGAAIGGYLLYEHFETASRNRAQVERLARERAEADAAALREAAERQAREHESALAQARAEAERLARERDEAAARASAEQAAAAQAERDRLAAEQRRQQQELAARREADASASSVRLLELDPPSGSRLAVGQRVQVSLAYAHTQPGGVRIVVIPQVGSAPAPNYSHRGSPLIGSGQGIHVADFTIKAGEVGVDGLHIEMISESTRKRLFEATLPVRYLFRPSSPSGDTGASDAKVQIVKAACWGIGADTYQLDVSGTVSAPMHAVMRVRSDGRFKESPTPGYRIECGRWSPLAGNACARIDSAEPGVRWVHQRTFAATTVPTYVEAVVYPEAKSKIRIAQHRLELACR